MRPEVPAILGVLRHAAIAGRGVLNVSDVEALDEAVAEHNSLLEALKAAPDVRCAYCMDTGGGWPQASCEAEPTCQEWLEMKGAALQKAGVS